uniref:Transient receptor potential cation channel subfamily M member 5 n=1 Tax=Nomascus leucogenys TaxID=61853 RepID=G1QQT5_NOMLE
MQDVQGPCPGSPGDAEAGRELDLHRGEVDFGGSGKKRGKFVRVPSGVAPSVLFDLLLAEWHLPAPNLVVSLVGEEQPFAMKSWLRDVLRKGLVKAAQSTGAWILTSALRVGLARHVGQAVRDHSLASTSTKVRVVAVGMASLGRILHRRILEEAQEGFPVHYPEDDGGSQGPLCSLDSNLSHFILVEPGPPGKGDGLTELRLRLEKHISEQRTGYGGTGSIEIPVLCLLVNGDPSTLERISRAVEQAAPWLILAGSGGIADVLAALVNQPHLLVPKVAEKQFKEKFPSEHFSWEDIVRWTKLLQNITSHQHLLTVYDFEQEGSEELDTVILKALVKGEGRKWPQGPGVSWDTPIAAKEVASHGSRWASCDLEEVMVDALVSNKPEFVRLFVDNGADVADFLTYGRLQQLYRSVSPKSLLFDLLQRKQEEARLTLAGLGTQQAREPPAGPPAFSLHEVSRVLKDFLQDACRGFYQDGRPGGRRKAEKGPAKRPTGQKWLLDLDQKSENPWRDLFLWAVLQNHHEMATYFWAMARKVWQPLWPPAKILKEMSHLGDGRPRRPELMREAKYEQLALDLFSECYSNSEDRTTCLHLATEADAKAFFAHDGVQAFLTRIWWGDMAAGTPILRLLGAFLCPALVYTNLITFRWVRPCGAACLTGAGSSACFWGAPVTVFLGNVVMYFAFLFLFTYVLLVDFKPPPQGPSGPEVTLYFWVFTLVLEEIRQVRHTPGEEVHTVCGGQQEQCDMVAIFLFIVGVTCRMLPSAFEAGRTVLAMDFMVFTLRLIHIFAIHKQLGPKIIVVERMVRVFFFLFFLSVWLVAYGVTTQALLHPHDGRLEWIFRRVLYRPYLQIFGQIPLDEIDEARVNCSTHPLLLEDSPSCPSLYANWLVILLLVTFLLVTNVLLMNLLIAMFSPGAEGAEGHSLTPPPLQPTWCTVEERDLPDPLDQKVVTWETVQKENFLSKMEKQRRDSEGEVLRKTAHSLPAFSCRRVDFVAKYLGGLREQEKRIKSLESQINYCSVLVSSVADMLAQGGGPWSSQHCGEGSQLVAADHRGGLDGREQPGAGQPPSDT